MDDSDQESMNYSDIDYSSDDEDKTIEKVLKRRVKQVS